MRHILAFACLFLTAIEAKAQQQPSTKKTLKKPPMVTGRTFSQPVVLPDSVVGKHHLYSNKPLPKVVMQKFGAPTKEPVRKQ